MELETRTLKAGTVVKMNGIPLALAQDAELETHPDNWKHALEVLQHESSGTAGQLTETN